MSNSANTPIAIVTGAGSGVGRAVALLLAGKGYGLALAGRRKEPLDETVALAERRGSAGQRSAVAIPTDVSDPAQARGLVDEVLSRFGRIDALINNAGMAEFVPMGETDHELLLRTLKVNTIGPWTAISAALPAFRKQGDGCVVNVSSMATADPFPGLCAYAASKCALESFARSLANERGEADIRAYNVAPGAIDTEMLRRAISEEELPSEQCLTPERVAEVIVDLVTGERDEPHGATVRLPSPYANGVP